eukprot:PhM_4_TR11987/c0_g1_i1/m.85372
MGIVFSELKNNNNNSYSTAASSVALKLAHAHVNSLLSAIENRETLLNVQTEYVKACNEAFGTTTTTTNQTKKSTATAATASFSPLGESDAYRMILDGNDDASTTFSTINGRLLRVSCHSESFAHFLYSSFQFWEQNLCMSGTSLGLLYFPRVVLKKKGKKWFVGIELLPLEKCNDNNNNNNDSASAARVGAVA